MLYNFMEPSSTSFKVGECVFKSLWESFRGEILFKYQSDVEVQVFVLFTFNFVNV